MIYALSAQNTKLLAALLNHLQRYLFTPGLEINGDMAAAGPGEERFHGQTQFLNLTCDIDLLFKPQENLLLICARPAPQDARGWTFATCFPQMPGASQDKAAADPDLQESLTGLDLTSLQYLAGQSPSTPSKSPAPIRPETAHVSDYLSLIAPAEQEAALLEEQNFEKLDPRFFLRQLSLGEGLFIYAYSADLETDSAVSSANPFGPALESMPMWQEWSAKTKDSAEQVLSDFEGGLLLLGNLAPPAAQVDPFAGTLGAFLNLPGGWSWSDLPAQGTIDYGDGSPALSIRLPFDKAQFGPVALEDTGLALKSPLSAAPGSSAVQLSGTITIINTALRIAVDFPLEENDEILVSAALVDGQQHFFDPEAHPLLPKLKSDEALRIELVFSKAERRLERLTLSAEVQEWEVLPQPFTFRELSMDLLLYPQEGSEALLIAYFLVDVGIGDSGLTFEGFYPHGSLNGRLDEGTTLKLVDLGGPFGVGDLMPDLAVDDLTFSYDLDSGEMVGQLHVGQAVGKDKGQEGWPHGALQDLRFWLRGPAPYLVDITAVMHIGGTTLNLSAGHTGTGWHFSGASGPGQDLSMDNFAGWLDDQFNTGREFHAALSSLTFHDLALEYDTDSGDFTFDGQGRLQIDDTALAITVHTSITKEGEKHKKNVTAKVIIGAETFDITFDGQTSSGAEEDLRTALVAYYEHDADGAKPAPDLQAMTAYLSSDLAQITPPISIVKAILGYYHEKHGQEETKAWLMGLESGLALNFSQGGLDLPVVSDLFDAQLNFALNKLQVLLTTKRLSAAVLSSLPSLPSFTLPEGSLEEALLSANLQIGDDPYPLRLALGGGGPPEPGKPSAAESHPTAQISPLAAPASATAPTAAANGPAAGTQTSSTADGVTWLKLHKKVGPIFFEKVGVRYEDGRLGLLLGASLTASGLTLSLMGFSIDSPFEPFDPRFGLSGLGIAFQSGPLEIAGAFLESTKDGVVQYSGDVLIKAETFTLSAIGAFASIDGNPSLFIFAFLDKPLGGPSFFFVTGIAAGFGYNRSLLLPTVDQIADFPLVSAAMAAQTGVNPFAGKTNDPHEALAVLDDYIKPEIGQNWLAVGVRFTSFEVVQSFALVTATFGSSFQLSLIGLSTLTMPTEIGAGQEPVGYAQLALRVTYEPSSGVLLAEGKLTPDSFIFSQACHLTGGFAFYVWFKDQPNGAHAGDFVVTIGGFHPRYAKPAYFPVVPRAGYNWVIDDLVIKGEFYFALTPSTVMAGGHYDAVWESGGIRAWFKADADFLLSWKPFHYEVSVGISLGASFEIDLLFTSITMTISVNISLNLWGPPFGGQATVDLSIISFTIPFGDDPPDKAAIPWSEFKASFLPQTAAAPQPQAFIAKEVPLVELPDEYNAANIIETHSYCFSRVANGLVKDLSGQGSGGENASGSHSWVVNGGSFELLIQTIIPAKSARIWVDGWTGTADLGEWLHFQDWLFAQPELDTWLNQMPKAVEKTLREKKRAWRQTLTGGVPLWTADIEVGPVGIVAADFESELFLAVNRLKAPGGPPESGFNFLEHVRVRKITGSAPKSIWSVDTAMNTGADSLAALNADPAGVISGTLSGFAFTPHIVTDKTPLPIDITGLQDDIVPGWGNFWSAPAAPDSIVPTTAADVLALRQGILNELAGYVAVEAENVGVAGAEDLQKVLRHDPQQRHLGEER